MIDTPHPLAHIGWSEWHAPDRDGASKPFDAGEITSGRIARIVEQHRARSVVHDGSRLLKVQTLAGLQARLEAAGDGLVVGDWVLIADLGGSLHITHCLPRRSLLTRSRGHSGVQRIVANVDTALLVMALDGDYSPNRLQRYLVLARSAEVTPVVLLTKPDRCDDTAARVDEIQRLAGPATPVHVLDPRGADAVKVLAPYLGPGRTLVLLGSSGVGKSTLLNQLLGNATQRTGAIRGYDDKGRHTTTARTLRSLPDGSCVIDTPGVRELRLDSDEAAVADAFEDIRALAAGCRFNDCRHLSEPGCAVIAAVTPERLAQYHKLRGEAAQTQAAVLKRERAAPPKPARR